MTDAERARRRRFARFMEAYYAAREAWERACEHATALYPAEVREFHQDVPPVLFKRWLIDSRGMPR